MNERKDQGNIKYRRHYSPKLKRRMTSYRSCSDGRKSRCWMAIVALFALAIAGLGCFGGLSYLIITNSPRATQLAHVDTRLFQADSLINNRLVEMNNEPLGDIAYNKTIGFIGDSLTYGCCSDATPAPQLEMELLGDGYMEINRGVNGSSTKDWLEKLLTPSLEIFSQANVDIVQIMLGTNDIGQGISIKDSIDNLRQIIRQLRGSGVELIIINKIPYSMRHDDIQIRQLNAALDELPNGVNVFIGDDQAYDFFKSRQSLIYDGIHMNQTGYEELAKLWTAGFKKVLTESQTIKLNLSAYTYELGSADDLICQIDKPTRLFSPSLDSSGLFIDNEEINPDYYIITSDGEETVLRIYSGKINQLSTGTHQITIRFADGLSYSQILSISE